MEGGSGEDQDADQQQPRRKRYHRHTVRQIQEMLFKECPHPDDKQRQRLSIELGLKPRQVKFWFQNRRTQMKAQQDRSDNAILRAQNENLRNENLALREAIKNVVCPNCGGPASLGDMSFDEQHLRLDNARLKEELDRVSSIASKYIGRKISSLDAPISPPMLMSSLDLAMGNFGKQSLLPSTDLVPVPPLADANLHAVAFMELEKPLALELAMNAMEELMRMAQTDEPLWLKNVNGMKDVLSLDEYARQFQWAMGFKHHTLKTEATKDSALVIMNGVALVDVLMDANKWVEMFPSIVSRAKTLQVLAPGVPDNFGSISLKNDRKKKRSEEMPLELFEAYRDLKLFWDVLSSGNLVQEVAHIANGSHPGNSISLLRVNACNTSQNVELILQESCTDASGSLVVYAPVDVPAINIAMSGENPSCIALLPSGFAILPDGPSGNRGLVSTSLLHEAAGSSSSTGLDSPRTGGSLLTVAFQVLVSTLPTAKLNLESVTTINNLICNTVQQIKAALHCTDA